MVSQVVYCFLQRNSSLKDYKVQKMTVSVQMIGHVTCDDYMLVFETIKTPQISD